MNMKRLLQAAVFSTAVSAAYSSVQADDYKFIISGDPVAAATEATSLNTGTLSVLAAAVPLEARYRTSDESDGIALRSDRFVAMIVIIR